MNQINPMKLLQLKAGWDQFKDRHPKFPAFIASVTQGAIKEDSVIDVTVTTADGDTVSTNLKVTKEDMELLEQLKELVANS